MEIRINGKTQTTRDGITIREFLETCSIDPAKVVVEINNSIIPRDSFGTQKFSSGDCVEILRFVGGG
jgi:sulfur carrier protein